MSETTHSRGRGHKHTRQRPGNHPDGHRRGPTSYHMQDPEQVFKVLALKVGETCLDLGCGPGDYTRRMAREVGVPGKVIALDRDPEAVRRLSNRELANVTAMEHDLLAGPLPLADASVDCCLITTVLHILNLRATGPALFAEVRRVLRPSGRLAVIECKKEDQPWGPPIERRLAPEEIEAVVWPCGFATRALVDLGLTYLLALAPAS